MSQDYHAISVDTSTILGYACWSEWVHVGRTEMESAKKSLRNICEGSLKNRREGIPVKYLCENLSKNFRKIPVNESCEIFFKMMHKKTIKSDYHNIWLLRYLRNDYHNTSFVESVNGFQFLINITNSSIIDVVIVLED